MAKLKVGFLIDKENSWFFLNLNKFYKTLDKKKYFKKISFNSRSFNNFDILFIVNYTKIINNSVLKKIKLPIVIHASDLPKGKGFSPLMWQVLENKKKIKVSMIKAVKKVDSGPIIFKKQIKLNGTELYDELRLKLSKVIVNLMKKLLIVYPNLKFKSQKGNSTFYKKRQPKDSNLNINKSLKSQFNLLRTCDNRNWPAFFSYKNRKYVLKIYKK